MLLSSVNLISVNFPIYEMACRITYIEWEELLGQGELGLQSLLSISTSWSGIYR